MPQMRRSAETPLLPLPVATFSLRDLGIGGRVVGERWNNNTKMSCYEDLYFLLVPPRVLELRPGPGWFACKSYGRPKAPGTLSDVGLGGL
jgi:hypothetical protein